MKKRITALFIVFVLIASITGCGKKNEGKTDSSPTVSEQKQDSSETNKDNKVNENTNDEKPSAGSEADSSGNTAAGNASSGDISNAAVNELVIVSLDKSYLDIDTQEELDVLVADKAFISGILADDGTVTLTMSTRRQEAYLEELANSFYLTLDAIEKDEESMPHIIKAAVNPEFTEIVLTSTLEEIDFIDFFTGYALLMNCELYNIIKGNPIDNVELKFQNADSGEFYYTMNNAVELITDFFGSLVSGGDSYILEEVDYPRTVLEDNEMFTFVIDRIAANDEWGYTLKTEFTNKTDKVLSFSAQNASVNDWVMDPWWGLDAEPGETMESDLYFSNYALKEHGITDVAVIEFELTARDAEEWFGDPLYDSLVYIYPHGEENSIPEHPEFDENVYGLVNKEDFNVLIPQMEYDSTWDTYEIRIFIENTGAANLNFSFDDISANGWTCNASGFENVPAGKMTMMSLDIPSEVLGAIGTTEPTEIEMYLNVFDPDNWSEDNLADGYYTVYPLGYDYFASSTVVSNLERPLADTDMLFDDNDLFTFVATDVEEDGWYYTVHTYFTNKSDRNLFVCVNNDIGVKLNGIDTDADMSFDILPGKSRISSFYWSLEDLQQMGIETVDSLEVPIYVLDSDTYDQIYSGTYSISLK